MSAGGLPWNIGLTSSMIELGGVIRSLGKEAVFSHTSGGGGELLASCLIVLMGAGASLSPLPAAGARGLARAATSSLPLCLYSGMERWNGMEWDSGMTTPTECVFCDDHIPIVFVRHYN